MGSIIMASSSSSPSSTCRCACAMCMWVGARERERESEESEANGMVQTKRDFVFQPLSRSLASECCIKPSDRRLTARSSKFAGLSQVLSFVSLLK